VDRHGRHGGKQYRVAAGDKIAVEKLAGEAGDKITLGDVCWPARTARSPMPPRSWFRPRSSPRPSRKRSSSSRSAAGTTIAASNGHRQQLTLLRILAVGGEEKKAAKKAAARLKPLPPAAE
jgi:large subunit ribosomal protein L21